MTTKRLVITEVDLHHYVMFESFCERLCITRYQGFVLLLRQLFNGMTDADMEQHGLYESERLERVQSQFYSELMRSGMMLCLNDFDVNI